MFIPNPVVAGGIAQAIRAWTGTSVPPTHSPGRIRSGMRRSSTCVGRHPFSVRTSCTWRRKMCTGPASPQRQGGRTARPLRRRRSGPPPQWMRGRRRGSPQARARGQRSGGRTQGSRGYRQGSVAKYRTASSKTASAPSSPRSPSVWHRQARHPPGQPRRSPRRSRRVLPGSAAAAATALQPTSNSSTATPTSASTASSPLAVSATKTSTPSPAIDDHRPTDISELAAVATSARPASNPPRMAPQLLWRTLRGSLRPRRQRPAGNPTPTFGLVERYDATTMTVLFDRIGCKPPHRRHDLQLPPDPEP